MSIARFFFNPYRVCQTTYGETPIPTFRKIAEAAEIGPDDLYLELGSGLGMTCAWVAEHRGCKVKGVEVVPLFVKLSKFLYRKAEFVCESMFDVDLSRATVIYYYHLDERRPVFENMQPGARLITISEPIQAEEFLLVKTIEVEFPWGKTEAHIQKRT